MSGAMQGYPSDIIPSQQEHLAGFPFVVEVKYQESWDLVSMMNGRCAAFNAWIEQLQSELRRLNKKFGMLFFRKSRIPWLVALPLSQLRAPETLIPRMHLGEYVIVPFSMLGRMKPSEVFDGLFWEDSRSTD